MMHPHFDPIPLPAVKPSPAPASYERLPMSRDRAYDIAIAFGLAMQDAGAVCPAIPRPNGRGWDLVVPAEFFAGLRGVAAYLPDRPGEPVSKPNVEPPPFKPEQD